jgi:regulator of cell morphogenesis and NO signaling
METPVFFHHETLADFAVDFSGATEIFEKYQLDYCCEGTKTLADACAEKGLSYEKVLKEVMESRSVRADQILRMDQWSDSFLTDFIVENYHKYFRQTLPMLRALLENVRSTHGYRHPILGLLLKQFDLLSESLLAHMQQEEVVLFPAIKKQEQNKNDRSNAFQFHLQKLAAAIHRDHQQMEELLRSFRINTDDYTPPTDANPTFVLLYRKLRRFDRELVNHFHIENNILLKRLSLEVK